MTDRAIQLYQELDDIVYSRTFPVPFIHAVVMSLWESDSSIITTGACLVSTIIYKDHCLVANGAAPSLPLILAGDCRAVLGRQSALHGAVEAVALTHDHNIREPAELRKLKQAHPSRAGEGPRRAEERDLVKYYNGEPVYVKGMLQPTRCIGDFVLKVVLEGRAHQRKEFIEAIPRLGRFARDFNPPYITATPEVTFFDIAERDQFIVLASDGVWDELENQAVVDIVDEVLRRGSSVEVAANTVIEACLAHAASGRGGGA